MRTTQTLYLLDNAASEASDRLTALSMSLDGHTQRQLLARGVGSGWHCLEIGAGNGSVAQWLADRVGNTGHVLATDIDTRHLEARTDRRFEVQRHDVTSDSLPEATFDLIHVRLVLNHVRDWTPVITKLVRALKPGGWIVDEEYDSDSLLPDPAVSDGETRWRTYDALAQLMRDRGFDRRFGRRLFQRMRAVGLREVGAEGRVEMLHAGTPGTALLRANWTQLRETMIEAGYVQPAEVERDLAGLDGPEFLMPSSILWTVWGRRPLDGSPVPV